MIVPKHVFESFKGAKSREAPANLKPVGTGAFRIVDFREPPATSCGPSSTRRYHVPNWPYFDTLEMKGGGDAASAARAVLQTGEYDYAWNMQVEDDILVRMEQGGKGRVNIWSTGNVEHTMCNFSDPSTEVEGERSSAKTAHPFLGDPAVRQALNLLVDRSSRPRADLWPPGRGHGEFPERACSPPLAEHALGVQCRQGEPDPGRRGLEAGSRRCARQGRQAPQDALPDRDECSAPEDPADHQAGGGQGRDRDRDQIRRGLGVLWLGIPPTPTTIRTSTRTSRC